MPDGRLMILMGGAVYVDKKLVKWHPQVSFSDDGVSFTEPVPVKFNYETAEQDWLWRTTWDDGIGYCANYYRDFDGNTKISLVKTTNGLSYDLVTMLDIDGFPNEATIQVLPDKRMFMMVRRDSGNRKGYWGVSNPLIRNGIGPKWNCNWADQILFNLMITYLLQVLVLILSHQHTRLFC